LSIIAQATPETTNTLIQFPPPTWLKHTPIYMLPYEPFDGTDPSNTDTKYLSIGLAQWRFDSDDEFALSIKAWRKPYDRWSRESEELPLHRHVDMTILLAHTIFHAGPSTDVELPAGTFENQTTPITLRARAEFPAESAPFLEHCRVRMRALRDTLNQLDPPTSINGQAAQPA
jgi:hypothetical protein